MPIPLSLLEQLGQHHEALERAKAANRAPTGIENLGKGVDILHKSIQIAETAAKYLRPPAQPSFMARMGNVLMSDHVLGPALLVGGFAGGKMILDAVAIRASYRAMLQMHPDLAADPRQDQIKLYFDTIASTSPTVAKKPLVAGTMIKRFLAYGGLDHGTVADLVNIESQGATARQKTMGLALNVAQFGSQTIRPDAGYINPSMVQRAPFSTPFKAASAAVIGGALGAGAALATMGPETQPDGTQRHPSPGEQALRLMGGAAIGAGAGHVGAAAADLYHNQTVRSLTSKLNQRESLIGQLHDEVTQVREKPHGWLKLNQEVREQASKYRQHAKGGIGRKLMQDFTDAPPLQKALGLGLVAAPAVMAYDVGRSSTPSDYPVAY